MPFLYSLHDSDESARKSHGMRPISPVNAVLLNKEGYGIYITVNAFKSEIRAIHNLHKILAWAIDIDDCSKEEQLERIKKGLIPSLIVESKRSLQVYWRAKDATFETLEETKQAWNMIMLDRLVPFYGADKNARDIARVLRMPGYYHMKDPNDPFMVEKIWEYDVSYTFEQMLNYYPDANIRKREQDEIRELKRKTEKLLTNGDTFWEKVYSLDCEYALTKLSGHECLNNEKITFRRNNNGNLAIYVNGKSTSAWIDRDKKIGSLSNGGPTIAQYIKWYGHDWKYIVEVIKKEFPECLDSEK